MTSLLSYLLAFHMVSFKSRRTIAVIMYVFIKRVCTNCDD